MREKMTIQSKQILPAMGYLVIEFSFKVMEIKKKTFYCSHPLYGLSKTVKNVKSQYRKLMKNAIWNGVKKIFPNRSVTPYNIIIMTYNITYYLDNYMIVEKNNKYYERWRDREKKRTVYSKISDKKEYEVLQEGYT
jgi:hypothetical protein